MTLATLVTPDETKESSLHGMIDWLERIDFLPTLSSHLNSRIFVYGVNPSCYRRVRGMMLIEGGDVT